MPDPLVVGSCIAMEEASTHTTSADLPSTLYIELGGGGGNAYANIDFLVKK